MQDLGCPGLKESKTLLDSCKKRARIPSSWVVVVVVVLLVMMTIQSVVAVVVVVVGRRTDSVRSAVGADKARSLVVFFHNVGDSWLVSGVVESRRIQDRKKKKEHKRKSA